MFIPGPLKFNNSPPWGSVQGPILPTSWKIPQNDLIHYFAACFMAYIIPQLAVYTTYVLPSGGLYATYHLSGEPETTIDCLLSPKWVPLK